MSIAPTDAPRSSFWSPNRPRNIFGHLGRIWATELVGFGSIVVGSGLYDTQSVPDPWSLVPSTAIKVRLFGPFIAWRKLRQVFFGCVLASLEIDAQDIKVALPRYHVLQ